jgi:hypothetical protein
MQALHLTRSGPQEINQQDTAKVLPQNSCGHLTDIIRAAKRTMRICVGLILIDFENYLFFKNNPKSGVMIKLFKACPQNLSTLGTLFRPPALMAIL